MRLYPELPGTQLLNIIARTLSGYDLEGVFCFSLWVQGGDGETAAVGPQCDFLLICFHRS